MERHTPGEMNRVKRNPRMVLGFLSVVALAFFVVLPVNAKAQPEKIKLLLGDVSLNKLAFVLAYEEGIYEKNGLDVQPMFTRGSVETIRRSGIIVPEEFIAEPDTQTPIRISGSCPTIVGLTTRAGRKAPIILGSTHRTSRWHIVARPDITSAEQLKGKRIGFSGVGAVSHFSAISFAEAMGWDPRFDWSMMSGALGVEALKKGYVDAMIAPELHGIMAVDAGFPVVVDLVDYHFPVAGSAIVVDKEWLKGHHDAARRFVKSAVDAIALLKNDKEATFRTLGKWYQMDDEQLMENLYREVQKLPKKPYPPVEGLKKVMEIYDSHEMRKYKVTDFYDESFVRDLDKSGYIDSLYD